MYIHWWWSRRHKTLCTYIGGGADNIKTLCTYTGGGADNIKTLCTYTGGGADNIRHYVHTLVVEQIT